MDSLFDKLGPLPSKRRSTYTRISEPQEEEGIQGVPNSQPPLLLGDGFLFQNSTIDKVRNRLRTLGNESDETEKKMVQAESTRLNPTQPIADLYEGAEELEGKKDKRSRSIYSKGTSAVSLEKTQIIPSISTIDVAENDIKLDVSSQQTTQGIPCNDKAQQSEPSLHTRMNRATREEAFDPERTLGLSAYNDTEIGLSKEGNHDPMHDSFGTIGLETCEDSLFQATVSDSSKSLPSLETREVEGKKSKRDEIWNTSDGVSEEHGKKHFSKEAFLKYFDEESGSEDDVTESGPENRKSVKGKGVLENINKNDDNRRLLGIYEHRLKGELDSKMCIQLDDDEEDDDEFNEHTHVPSSRVSKATLLEIKARMSKKKSLSKMKQERTSLNDLVCSLKKASKRQISDRQREIVERRGRKLEDIDKEKKEIESLLEREIARNKRLALREKEATISAGSERGSSSSVNESEASDLSDFESSGSDLDDDKNDDKYPYYEEDIQEIQKQEQAVKEVDTNDILAKEDLSDEEDEGLIRHGRMKNHKILLTECVDSESNEIVPKNAIDLGPYGSNLHSGREEGLTAISRPEEMDSEKKNADELIRQKIQQIEIRKKKEEQKERKLKEMEAKGINKILEMEAEESEDEWKGIGGVDGDFSEENSSDLEEMIDDLTKSTDNLDNVRQLLAKEDKEVDEKMINKILFDIKNGGFRRRNRDLMNLDLTDEEDEDLHNYQLKRRELMEERRIQYRDQEESLKNSKSKAFLDSMVDDVEESKNPFGDPEMNVGNRVGVDTQEAINKGKNTLSEEFVQRSLSFLTNNDVPQEFELEEHTTAGSEGHDLSSLKKNSSINALTTSPIREELVEEEKQDEDFISLPNFRPPPLAKSIASGFEFSNKCHGAQKTVTVSKSFRAVGGNRSSVTYFSKMRKLAGFKVKNGVSSKVIRPLSSLTMGKLLTSQQSCFEK